MITDDLVFDFLVALDGFFNQHLMNRAESKAVPADLDEFSLVVCKSASCTAEGESRTQDNRIPDLFSRCFRFFQIIGDP